MVFYLETTCRSSLAYGSAIDAELIKSDALYTFLKLRSNGLVIRIMNTEILSIGRGRMQNIADALRREA